jgi:3-oxoacyl-[acyl-carrier protein] reductase
MNLDLTNKRALIGGGSKGLGLATGIELSLLGASVTLTGRDESSLQKALTQLDTTRGQQHDYLVLDFKQPESLQAAVNRYLSNGSDGRTVHILVNNTGGPLPGKAIDMSPRQYVEVFEMQLANFQFLVQSVVPGMKKAGFGRILNITGTTTKEPLPEMGLSTTVRSAVAAWAKTLAGELGGFGITVNNLLPGSLRTDRSADLIQAKAQRSGKPEKEIEQAIVADIPAGVIGDPADFGAVAAFLCTPSAGYINGVNLPVDGGKLKGL